MSAVEQVVLLDELGNAIGVAPKADVHHLQTPLHLAFSCYVFDEVGRLLLTQRALHKPTFPGVWTNSFCGHPAPGEDFVDALHRRAGQELGVELRDLRLALPAFRYDATMANGVRENEMCPVFTAVVTGEVRPDPAEVEAWEWTPWTSFRDDVLAARREISSWCSEQVAALAERELAAAVFRDAEWGDLPPAAVAEQA